MRKTIIATLLALVLVIAGAPPAVATYRGTSCGTWTHTGSAQGCVMTNDHKQARVEQGLFRATITSGGTNKTVTIDYVRLLRNGVVVEANETNVTLSIPSGSYVERDTGWDLSCYRTDGTYQTKARYQFRHTADGHVSGWITRSSGTWVDTIHCEP